MLVALALASPAVAQQGVTVPSREQIEPLRPEAQAGSVRIDDRTARPPCAIPASADDIELRALAFTSADGEPLTGEVRSLLDQVKVAPGRHPVSILCDLRDQAATLLSRAGYIAGVRIPAQEVDQQIARLTVVLAHFDDVRITGTAGRYARLLEARAATIKALRPVKRRDLERILLLADDVPGLDVTIVLRPAGTEDGAIIGELTAHFRSAALVSSIDNMGSQAIGPLTGSATAELYGLTGLSDRSYVGVSTTLGSNELKLLQLGHYMGDGRGTTFGLRYSYAWTRPSLFRLDIRSRSSIAGFDLNRQLLRSTDRNLAFGVGLELIDQQVDLHAFQLKLPLSKDRLRVAYARLAGSAVAGAHSLSGEIELRQGLGLFGASKNGSLMTSRPGGDPTATVLRASAQDVITLGGGFSLAAVANGQWANDSLLVFEQYSIGNYTIGRGYDPGSATGDRALGFRLEPRFDLATRGGITPQLFGFVDHAHSWLIGAGAGGDFTSLGGGLRLTAGPRLSAEAIFAHRLDRSGLLSGTSTSQDRLLASFTLRF